MNVLFVCNGNVARSQEAEIFFNTLKEKGDSVAYSGGINVKLDKPIDPMVVEVMNEIGYDVSSALRKFADESLARNADLVVSFKPKDELPDYLLQHNSIRYWEVPDPQHQSIEFHREVRDTVKQQVRALIRELSI